MKAKQKPAKKPLNTNLIKDVKVSSKSKDLKNPHKTLEDAPDMGEEQAP